jgi:hypothetical protein
MPYVDYFVLDTSNMAGHWYDRPSFNFNLQSTVYHQIKKIVRLTAMLLISETSVENVFELGEGSWLSKEIGDLH